MRTHDRLRFALLSSVLLSSAPAADLELEELWSVPLGGGFSSVAVDGGLAFASFRAPGSEETTVLSLDVASGEEEWRASFHDPGRAGQEDYGGGRGPHATPLVRDGVVVVLGYGGALVGLDRNAGRVLWSVDLIRDLGARPVQFGFGASPVAHEERVLVMSGGEAGVTAFDLTTGEVAWRSPAFEASYVTPLLTSIDGSDQLVCLFQDETVGLDPEDGSVLWSVPHARPGLTNYAMVTDVGGGRFIVSGQGNAGARRIDVVRDGSGWRATVGWSCRSARFSHGRVVRLGEHVYGSNGSMLCAVSIDDGSLAFKLRGFGESNFVAAKGVTLRLDEEGELTLLRLSPERIGVLGRRRLLEGKAWAAPTVIEGDLVLARDARRLVALRLLEGSTGTAEAVWTETGYDGGATRLPAAVLAFAAGRYVAEDGGTLTLRSDGSTLEVSLPGEETARTLVARSESRFDGPDGGRLELVRGTAVTPERVTWTRADRKLTAARVPIVAVDLGARARERVLGAWRVAGAIDLDLRAERGELAASSSQYPGVTFRVTPESDERLWLDAVDAPYGIPRVLIEVDGDGLAIHQDTDTVRGVRAGD
ncbi:MAG: PQQ-binding-like beta-propeller repeat protein [Planctomycetota bacterium]